MRGRLGWRGALCAAACIGVLSAGAPLALGAGGNAVVNDCQAHGVLTRSYTLSQLEQALRVMPASTKQYTDCYDVVQKAIADHNRTGAAGGSSGGSFLPTPVIVILVILILAGVTFGAIAIRRRQGGGPGGPTDSSAGADGPSGGADDPPDAPDGSGDASP
jgi:hypothetical protein